MRTESTTTTTTGTITITITINMSITIIQFEPPGRTKGVKTKGLNQNIPMRNSSLVGCSRKPELYRSDSGIPMAKTVSEEFQWELSRAKNADRWDRENIRNFHIVENRQCPSDVAFGVALSVFSESCC